MIDPVDSDGKVALGGDVWLDHAINTIDNGISRGGDDLLSDIQVESEGLVESLEEWPFKAESVSWRCGEPPLGNIQVAIDHLLSAYIDQGLEAWGVYIDSDLCCHIGRHASRRNQVVVLDIIIGCPHSVDMARLQIYCLILLHKTQRIIYSCARRSSDTRNGQDVRSTDLEAVVALFDLKNNISGRVSSIPDWGHVSHFWLQRNLRWENSTRAWNAQEEWLLGFENEPELCHVSSYKNQVSNCTIHLNDGRDSSVSNLRGGYCGCTPDCQIVSVGEYGNIVPAEGTPETRVLTSLLNSNDLVLTSVYRDLWNSWSGIEYRHIQEGVSLHCVLEGLVVD